MPTQNQTDELNAVLEAVRKFPDGATLRNVRETMHTDVDERTIRRWLDLLVEQKLVSRVGAARATRYCAKLTRPATANPTLPGSAGVPPANIPPSQTPSVVGPIAGPPALRPSGPSPSAIDPLSRQSSNGATADPPSAIRSDAGHQAIRPSGTLGSATHIGWQWKNKPAYNAAPGENPFDYMLRQIDEFGRGPTRAADYVQAETRLYIPEEQQGAFLAAMRSALAKKFANW